MARVRYVPMTETETAHPGLHRRLTTERKVPTANLFLALSGVPDILDGFLTYANAIRSSSISPKLREMAILTVGHSTNSEYEVAHHHSHALKAGLTEAQYQAIADFETSALFSPAEKAVMHFAKASTLAVDVPQAIWDEAAAHLSEREMLELALNVAWYNSGVRIMGALGIELEDSYRDKVAAV
jgi:alkylhydroperoxidase family enzyme